MNKTLQFVGQDLVGYGNLTQIADESGVKEITNVEVEQEIYDDALTDMRKYILVEGEVIANPDYEAIIAQEEQDKINNLTMTALDFVTLLRNAGVTAQEIKAYLDANIDLDMQLKYCQNVYCGVVRQLLPLTIGELTITDEMVVNAFKVKNGIIDIS
jgi:hypothetical protein